MRGCLLTLVLLVVVAIAASWLALPALAGTLIEGALVAAGFEGTGTSVEVSADPPPKLLSLQADAVRIHSTRVTYRNLQAADLDLTLRDVQLVERTYGSIDGTLTGVRLSTPAGTELSVPLVTLSGTADGARARMTVSSADIEALAASTLEAAIGTTPTTVALAAPDRIRIEGGGLTVDGRLAVRDDGSLVLVPPEGSVIGPLTLVEGGPEAAFRVVSFRVAEGGLELVMAVDLPLG